MISILIFMFFPYLIFGDSFDPDLDICSATALDAAVYSDDGFTYVFKGNYFWQTQRLDNSSGTIGFGNLTTSKWPEVKGKIKGVFVAKVGGTVATLFVISGNWIAYQKGKKFMEGSTATWETFDGLKVTTIMAKSRDSGIGLVLHTDNKKLTAFDFSMPMKTKKLTAERDTNVRDKYILFIDDPLDAGKSPLPGKAVLPTLLDVKASITYDKSVVLIATDKYCVIDVTKRDYQKTCDPKGPTSKLIGCPINTEGRPATALPPKQNVPEAVISAPGKSGMALSDPNAKQDNSSLVTSKSPSNGTDTIDVDKSNLYAIVFNVTLFCITIVVIIVIAILSKIINKSPKGTDYFIK